MSTALTPVRALAQFNKVSGRFICFLSYVDPATLDSTYFNYAEVNVDIERQTVKGTYPTFQIVTVAEQPTRVMEGALRAKCRDKILKEYGLDNQLDIIRSVVQHVAEIIAADKGVEITDLDQLQEMNAYIDEVKASHKALVASYKNREDYELVTIEQEQLENEEKLEGGLHELVYGPRQVNL